jgi:NADPH:quinone reductase-like Zn-dependent oxidoreductase
MAEMTGIQVQLVKQGGPFEIVQSPKPVPASNEVVVKLKAVALNPVDWKQMLLPTKSCKI